MADVGGFFKKMGKTIGEAADKTAKTAGDLTQKGKYKVEINKYEGEIKTVKASLGKDIIEGKLAGKGDAEVLEMVSAAFTRVQELNAEIARVETLIAEVGIEAETTMQEAAPVQEAPVQTVPVETIDSAEPAVETCGCGVEKSQCGCHKPQEIEVVGSDVEAVESTDSGVIEV